MCLSITLKENKHLNMYGSNAYTSTNAPFIHRLKFLVAWTLPIRDVSVFIYSCESSHGPRLRFEAVFSPKPTLWAESGVFLHRLGMPINRLTNQYTVLFGCSDLNRNSHFLSVMCFLFPKAAFKIFIHPCTNESKLGFLETHMKGFYLLYLKMFEKSCICSSSCLDINATDHLKTTMWHLHVFKPQLD